MKIVLFYHSLVSDWNHGNAHFLRGLAGELQRRGVEVEIYEPLDSWSRRNLVQWHGNSPIREFHQRYPHLSSRRYSLEQLDLDRALEGAGLVLVHEWNDPELVRRIGEHRRSQSRYRLLFHDTHHRSATAESQMEKYDLSAYDGALVFGEVIRRIYLRKGWVRQAWTLHEGADVRVFHPQPKVPCEGDLLWIGNWGDEERTAELEEFLIKPSHDLRLRTHVYGVRYPESAIKMLANSGIEYRAWLPNYRAPEQYAAHRVTLHVPRRPYVEKLPGIPTIRVFEALACGTALVCCLWRDTERLFSLGRDYLRADDGQEMKRILSRLLADPSGPAALGRNGRYTILARHTCAHRADQLLEIAASLGAEVPPADAIAV